MAEKAERKNNKTIIGVICAAVALIVVVVLLVLFLRPGGIGFGGIDDKYFVSDGTKLVMTLDKDEMSLDEEEYAPKKLHQVYYYSGQKVTGMSYFYEYDDAASAKTAYEHIKDEEDSQAKEIKLNGKYIEIVVKEEMFEDTTVDEVKENIEFMEMLKNMNYDDGMTDDVVEFDDTEEEDDGEEDDIIEGYEDEDF